MTQTARDEAGAPESNALPDDNLAARGDEDRSWSAGRLSVVEAEEAADSFRPSWEMGAWGDAGAGADAAGPAVQAAKDADAVPAGESKPLEADAKKAEPKPAKADAKKAEPKPAKADAKKAFDNIH